MGGREEADKGRERLGVGEQRQRLRERQRDRKGGSCLGCTSASLVPPGSGSGETDMQGEEGFTEHRKKSGPSQDFVPYSTNVLPVGKNSVTINNINDNNHNDDNDEHRTLVRLQPPKMFLVQLKSRPKWGLRGQQGRHPKKPFLREYCGPSETPDLGSNIECFLAVTLGPVPLPRWAQFPHLLNAVNDNPHLGGMKVK